MRVFILGCLLIVPSLVWAEDDPHGVLNPDEMSWESVLEKATRGETGMTVCASGYFVTKKGEHGAAREIFEACARDRWTGTMTWMSQMDNNGLGGEYNPEAAAKWDRRAADLGDPVGKFNHGLNLMRGHGIRQDETLGRQFVDEAASDGLDIAIRLQEADYDLDEVTPDADNWKYAPVF